MRRRELLSLPGLPLLAAAAPKLRVSRLEFFTVQVNARGNWLLVRVSTDGGIQGVGDASHGGAYSNPDREKIQLLEQFFARIAGRSPFDIEALREQLRPEVIRGGAVAAIAFSAIEQCLYDIQGQALGVPCYQLFGGKLRDAVRCYANINRSTRDRSPEDFARLGAAAAEAGFDAIKLAPFDDMPKDLSNAARVEEFTRKGIARAAAVRNAIGPERALLVDVHSHLDVARGIELAGRLEPLNLFWLEEVTPPEPAENLAAIRRAARMRTAGGESLYGVEQFHRYIASGAVDVIMPDVKYCGGMLELKKIAALAEGAGLAVSPHGPASPIGNIAAAHACAGMPNFLILESAFGEVPWRAELTDPPEQIEKGRFAIPDRPGFGFRLNEKTLRRYAA